ncbi:MAG: ATP-binding protein [Chitinophagaceae bacterium]
MNETNFVEYMPDYLDLLNAFRKLGYNTSAAIADLTDNPYDAGASKCWITLKKGANVIDDIVISDNGRGMSQFELHKALIPASTGRIRKYHNELGFFGVGMVSAGLSLGNRIEVYTRGIDGDLYSYIDWEEKMFSNNPVNIVRKCTKDESETVLTPYLHGSETGSVIWISKTSIAQTRYESLMKQLEFHLGTTYHGLKDSYQVYINNEPVMPWDILESSKNAHLSDVQTFTVNKIVNGKRVEGVVSLQFSYIWSENQERKHPTIMGRTNENQGGALVRNGRTLTFGTMMGIAEKTPLHNALRFRVSYDNPDLDNLVFNINVQKDDCQVVDKDVWEWLQGAVKAYIKEQVRPLNKRYRASKSSQGRVSSIRPSGKKLPISVDRNKFVANHALTQR